jgi:ATP-dependent DNA helicase DinG
MLTSPKDPQGHTREIVEWLPKLVDIAEAVGTLVLFSSRKQMQDVAAALPENLRAQLLIQGKYPKACYWRPTTNDWKKDSPA